MSRNKVFRGEGWEFIPADSDSEESQEPKSSLSPGEQQIRIGLEKRPKGKQVSVAKGFVLTAPDLKKLAKDLKNRCGSGGSAKDDAIEIQGDLVATIKLFLVDRGYRVK